MPEHPKTKNKSVTTQTDTICYGNKCHFSILVKALYLALLHKLKNLHESTPPGKTPVKTS